MSFMSQSWRRSIGELYFNNRVDNTSNPICNALQVSVATTTIPALYVSLHTTNPGQTGTGEVTTTAYVGYQRAQYSRDHLNPPAGGAWWTYANVTAGSESVGRFQNASAIQWPTCSGGTSPVVKYWGLWTAQSSGNFIVGGPIQEAAAIWRVGYVQNGTFDRIYAEGHGFTGGELITLFSPYQSLGGDAAGGFGGIERVVGAVSTDYFDLTVAVSGLGPVLYTERSSITVDSGKIPNAPANSISVYLA